MTNRWLKAFLIVSLAFNFAVVGTIAYGWIVDRNISTDITPSPDEARRSFIEKSHRLSRYIGLSEEKTRQFEKIMLDSHREAEKYREKLHRDRDKLIALLKVREMDKEALMRTVDDISIHQRDLEKILIQRIASVRSILSEEESEKFIKLVECSISPECCERQGKSNCRTSEKRR